MASDHLGTLEILGAGLQADAFESGVVERHPNHLAIGYRPKMRLLSDDPGRAPPDQSDDYKRAPAHRWPDLNVFGQVCRERKTLINASSFNQVQPFLWLTVDNQCRSVGATIIYILEGHRP